MTTSLVFDKTAYDPAETINFQVVTTETMTMSVGFSGTLTLPNGAVLPVYGPVQITGAYGPFSGFGYTVTQSATDPTRFTAIPAGS